MPVLFGNTGKRLSLFGELHYTVYFVLFVDRLVPNDPQFSLSVKYPDGLQWVPQRENP